MKPLAVTSATGKRYYINPAHIAGFYDQPNAIVRFSDGHTLELSISAEDLAEALRIHRMDLS